MSRDRLLSITIALVQAGRVLNVLAAVVVLLAALASFPAGPWIEARLLHKYGADADIAAMMTFMRATLLFAVPVGVIVERLLRALRTVLATVVAGEPFAPANTARLHTIGWMLLALQLADLAFGGLVLTARHLRIDYVLWQPSFTGWITTLVAFALVRVFAAGTVMRDDLAGTV